MSEISDEYKTALGADSVENVLGPSILLGSGTYFHYERPEETKMTIEDVAYALGFECRFAGQCWSPHLNKRVFYSVGEHCVRMSHAVPPEMAFEALMHEVGETPCGDMTNPLKGLCPDYKRVEKSCEAGLLKHFGVVIKDPVRLKHWDLVMLATERRDLLRWGGERWSLLDGIDPLEERILPWGPYEAAEAFLNRYNELRG